jgi:hypothetical protein
MSALADPAGYVLLAASRESESAYEDVFGDAGKCGALTYWLLESLNAWTPGMTFADLHDRILARVHARFEAQTPMLIGDGARAVFGVERIAAQPTSLVLEAGPGDQLVLEAGQATGARAGARFAIFPAGTRDFGAGAQRSAIARVTIVGAERAQAEVIQRDNAGAIAPGDPAVLIDPGDVQLRRSARLSVLGTDPDDPDRPHPVAAGAQHAALEAVRAALSDDARCAWVSVVEDSSVPVEFQVVVDAARNYALWDGAGAVLPVRPALPIADATAAARTADRLVHLTKYRNMQALQNYDALSRLAKALRIEVVGWQANYQRGNPPAPQPFGDTPVPVIKAGHTLFLRINNMLPRVQGPPGQPEPNVLNVAVLDLQPDWGISQVYPGASGRFIEVTPGVPHVLSLKAGLPAGIARGKDVIKVFATLTTKAANFRPLTLPALDQPQAPREAALGARDALGALFAALTDDAPTRATRTFSADVNPSDDWTSAQVEVIVEA